MYGNTLADGQHSQLAEQLSIGAHTLEVMLGQAPDDRGDGCEERLEELVDNFHDVVMELREECSTPVELGE